MPVSRKRKKKASSKHPNSGVPIHHGQSSDDLNAKAAAAIGEEGINGFSNRKSPIESKALTSTLKNHYVSRSQIQYSLITVGESHKVGDFLSISLELIRQCPKDLLQLRDPILHYHTSWELLNRKGYDLYTFPNLTFTHDTEESLERFERYSSAFNEDLVKVFLVDPKIPNHEYVARCLEKIPFAYFAIAGELSNKKLKLYNKEKRFRSGREFIGLINKDLGKINDELHSSHGLGIDKFDFPEYDWINQRNPYYDMDVTRNNYYTLNQIWGNFWKEKPVSISSEEKIKKMDERSAFQISQINELDAFHQFINTKTAASLIEPTSNPLVIVAPYHFPNYSKFRKAKTVQTGIEKLAIKLSGAEQSKNYTFDLTSYDLDEKGAYLASKILSRTTERFLLLDKVGFLHAQFAYSPLYRFPVIGKSINLELSHLGSTISEKRKVVRKMQKVGEMISEHSMTPEFIEMLKQRNGQIVFISDLPTEWLRLGKYPLVMTHDICRLPQFNHNSLFNLYIQHQRLTYSIGENILEKTLVIHCASETDISMHQMFKAIDIQKEKLNFNSVICKNVDEIEQAVRKYNPELLIFDCHGSFDEKSLSSFLIINGEKKSYLTGEDIVERSISAPLVFISACSTMPTYGYVRLLSDAFFQAGAFAVTATYLPIKMVDATILIVRILNGLARHKDQVFHHNWLSFLMHTLRGTVIYETIRMLQAKKKLPEDIDKEKISGFLTELMVFDRREKTFENLLDFIRTLNPEINISFDDLEHEWLSYTTMGRADLIYFDNYIAKHRENQIGQLNYDRFFVKGEAIRYPADKGNKEDIPSG